MTDKISPTTRYWVAPYRIANSIAEMLKLQGEFGQQRFIHMVSETRKRMLSDAKQVITEQKLHNPTIYLWEKRDLNSDFLMGFFIGDRLTLSKIKKEMNFKVFEHLEVQTSQKSWLKRLKDRIHEITTGEKPDPKTLDPYS